MSRKFHRLQIVEQAYLDLGYLSCTDEIVPSTGKDYAGETHHIYLSSRKSKMSLLDSQDERFVNTKLVSVEKEGKSKYERPSQ